MARLSPRDYQIIDLYLLGTLTATEIAQRLACSRATVNYCLRKPEARVIIERKRAGRSDANNLPSHSIRAAADTATLHALQTLVELTKNSNAESVRLSAAQTIMQSRHEITRGLADLPDFSGQEWDLFRNLASVGFGNPGVTLAQAFVKLNEAELAAQESAKTPAAGTPPTESAQAAD